MSVLVPILKQGLWQRPHVPEEVPEELQGHLSQEDYQQVKGELDQLVQRAAKARRFALIRGLVLFLVFLAAAIPFMVFGALGTVLDSVMNFRLFVISAAFGFCSIPCAFSAYHAATVPLSRCKGPTNMPNSTFNQLHRQYPGIHWQYLEGTESDESNVVVAAFQATLVAADSEAGTN
ncbi:unnamed protein product [Durusdinium trenchii]|uniref:Uncharacterized protein n=2 Tax=Durusdinium trenchii TaxID=1381693 RepID=A0ABP0IWH4_9DINO